jgi:bifunctional enzyme CysN/CysC
VSLFWLGRVPLLTGRDYGFRLGTARATARVEAVGRVLDPATLESREQRARVDAHEVAECVLQLDRAVAFDLTDEIAATSRFVLVDDFDVRGGGIVREALPDTQTWVRDRVLLRNYRWEPSAISTERRAERFSQRPALLLVTGSRDSRKKALARELEARLFAEGRSSTSWGSATSSTASTPTSTAGRRTAGSTSGGWPRSRTSCSTRGSS